MSAGADSVKSILFALGANFLIALAKTAARSSPGRRRCLQLGPVVMVAVKAKMRPAASAQALVESINRVEQGFRAAFPQVQWLFFEPDLAD